MRGSFGEPSRSPALVAEPRFPVGLVELTHQLAVGADRRDPATDTHSRDFML